MAASEFLSATLTARRFVICLGLFFAAAIGFKYAYSYDGTLLDPDSWWHIKTGADIMAAGKLPVTDSYSHSFFGKPWIAKEWLSQIIIALAYAASGWNGVALLAALAATATAYAFYCSLAAALRPHLAVIIAVCSVTLASNVFVARPHMLAMVVVVVWTTLLFRAADALKPPRLIWLALLVLWSNLHSSFTLGMVIAGFAALHMAEQTRLRDRALLARWAIFLLLCPLAALIHPYTYEPFRISLEMMRGNEATAFILEWQPFNAQTDKLYEYFLLICLFALLKLRLELSWSKIAFILFTLHMFLTHGRFSYVFFLLAPIAIAADLARQYPRISAETWKLQARDRIENFVAKRFAPLVTASAAACALAAGLYLAMPGMLPPSFSYPKGAMAYVLSQKPKGNVFNHYNFGGVLVFHDIKTLIDGRTDQIFLQGFATKTTESAKQGKEIQFAELLKDYKIDWTMLPPADARVEILKKDPDWLLAYSDADAVIQIRRASLR